MYLQFKSPYKRCQINNLIFKVLNNICFDYEENSLVANENVQITMTEKFITYCPLWLNGR